MRLSYCVQEVKHEIVQKNFRLCYCVQEGEMCDCVLKVIHEIKLLCTGSKT